MVVPIYSRKDQNNVYIVVLNVVYVSNLGRKSLEIATKAVATLNGETYNECRK